MSRREQQQQDRSEEEQGESICGHVGKGLFSLFNAGDERSLRPVKSVAEGMGKSWLQSAFRFRPAS